MDKLVTDIFFLVEPDLNDVIDLKINNRGFQEMVNSFGQTGLVMMLENDFNHELCIETALGDDGVNYLFVTKYYHKIVKEPDRYIGGAGQIFLNEYDEEKYGIPFQNLVADLFERGLIDYNTKSDIETD